MDENVKQKLDAIGTEYLFHMFHRAFAPTVGDFDTPAELISKHKKLVEGSCRVLERLRLVTPDGTLPFGFKPTPRLFDIVLRRSLRPLKNSKKASASIEENDVLNSIFDAALADEEQDYVCPLARVLLYVLGLIVHSKDGSEVPTRELRVLAAERREEERQEKWRKAVETGEWQPPKGVFHAVHLPS
jgi:hypothetical protein